MALVTIRVGIVIYRYNLPIIDILVAIRAAPRIIFFVVRNVVAGFTGFIAGAFARVG
jgi:hypothetical protein